MNIINIENKTCEYCGKQLKTLYATGRFCNKNCARAFSTKNDKNQTKICKCKICGVNVEVGKRTTPSNVLCEKCKLEKALNNKVKKHIIKRNIVKSNKINKIPYTYVKVCKLTGLDETACANCKLKQLNICKTLTKMNTSKPLSILNLKYIGTPDVIDEILMQKQILENLYKQGLSSTDINEIYNGKRTEYLMHNILCIPRRKLSDAIKNSFLMGKGKCEHTLNIDDYQFKTEWHTTWNDNLVFLRSSYEIDYANELDEQKIDYEVENLRIKYFDTQRNEYRCAIPDFYLPNTNTIVEIKSTFTLDIQNMKDKVNAYKKLGYNFKLILEHKEEDLYNIKIENKKVIYLK